MITFTELQVIIGMVMYFCAEGVTEGLASSRYTYFWGLEYHVWRLVFEIVGVIVIAAAMIGWLSALGWAFILSFLYERFLRIAKRQPFWKAAPEFQLQQWRISWNIWYDWARVIIGVGLLYGAIKIWI